MLHKIYMCGLSEDASVWWDQSICDNIILLFSGRIRLSSHIMQDGVAAQHSYMLSFVCCHEMLVSILLSDFFSLSALSRATAWAWEWRTVKVLQLFLSLIFVLCEFNLPP